MGGRQVRAFMAAGVLVGLAVLLGLYFLGGPHRAHVAAVASAGPQAVPIVPHIEDAQCWFDIPAGRAARCGWLVAAETPGSADGRFVHLPFVVFRSAKAEGEAPLVFLHGGPGEPAGLTAEGVARWWQLIDQSEWLTRQDLVVFDQRGAGLAEPSLKCPELKDAGYTVFLSDMAEEAAAVKWRAAAKSCYDRLTAAGIPLGSYNTEASAHDLASLLDGLGYKSWNLYGVSYGTRLALAFLRQHPEGTRSAILDSVYPPTIHAYVEAPANAARAFARLFEDCAKRASCQAANPGLAASFRTLAQRAAASPLAVPLASDAAKSVPLDSAKLMEVLFGGFYSWLDITDMPGAITAASRGNLKPLAPLAGEALETYSSDDFSYGLFLSTECHDDWAWDTPEAIAASASSADLFAAFARVNLPVVTCPVWPVGAARPAFHDAVRSDVPVLILAGDYDPVTPPAWAEAAATTLPHSTVIHFPGIGHDVMDSHRCADHLASRFLGDPSKQAYHDCLIAVLAGPWSQTDDASARPPRTRALGAKAGVGR